MTDRTGSSCSAHVHIHTCTQNGGLGELGVVCETVIGMACTGPKPVSGCALLFLACCTKWSLSLDCKVLLRRFALFMLADQTLPM